MNTCLIKYNHLYTTEKFKKVWAESELFWTWKPINEHVNLFTKKLVIPFPEYENVVCIYVDLSLPTGVHWYTYILQGWSELISI